MSYFITALKKYAVFGGRAARSEYWFFYLFSFIFMVIIGIIDIVISLAIGYNTNMLSALFSLAIFIPGLAVLVRRLHDIGKSGWWFWIGLIPLAGPIWLLVLLCTDSNQGDNKYGTNPKGATANLG